MSMTGANGGPFQGIFDCCIAGGDADIQRRPYHKNCKCALHRTQPGGHCATRCNRVAYPIRRTWSDGCLSLMNTTDATSLSPGRAMSPATAGKISRTRTQLILCEEENKEDLQGDQV